MNNIIQFLIGFRLPDIGYWNILPRHFTSLLYLGEIYRNLSEVTLKKECRVCKWNTVSAVCNLCTIWSHLTRNETLHSGQNSCGLSTAYRTLSPHYWMLHVTSRESGDKIFTHFSVHRLSSPSSLFPRHKSCYNTIQYFFPPSTFVPCILI
jgi:hypothetical protein